MYTKLLNIKQVQLLNCRSRSSGSSVVKLRESSLQWPCSYLALTRYKCASFHRGRSTLWQGSSVQFSIKKYLENNVDNFSLSPCRTSIIWGFLDISFPTIPEKKLVGGRILITNTSPFGLSHDFQDHIWPIFISRFCPTIEKLYLGRYAWGGVLILWLERTYKESEERGKI